MGTAASGAACSVRFTGSDSAASVAINATFGALGLPALAALMEETPSLLQQTSLILLAGLFLRSMVRRGLRSFVGELREGLGWSH